MSAPHSEVLEWYRDNDSVAEAATVGEYIRVVTDDMYGGARSCFGPTQDGTQHGWQVVEIHWNDEAFLIAPIDGEIND